MLRERRLPPQHKLGHGQRAPREPARLLQPPGLRHPRRGRPRHGRLAQARETLGPRTASSTTSRPDRLSRLRLLDRVSRNTGLRPERPASALVSRTRPSTSPPAHDIDARRLEPSIRPSCESLRVAPRARRGGVDRLPAGGERNRAAAARPVGPVAVTCLYRKPVPLGRLEQGVQDTVAAVVSLGPLRERPSPRVAIALRLTAALLMFRKPARDNLMRSRQPLRHGDRAVLLDAGDALLLLGRERLRLGSWRPRGDRHSRRRVGLRGRQPVLNDFLAGRLLGP